MLEAASRAYAWAWEGRRRAYAAGWRRPHRVPARVVSVGNMAVGGTGKTTLTVELARRAADAGRNVAVVCRRYRPGPRGRGDEELLLAASLGQDRVHAGRSKRRLAERAAEAGHELILVDDGFSTWSLERDLDVVLLDAEDPWAGGTLLPSGRLREPRRALQRAHWVVISHAADRASADAALRVVRRYAPAAQYAAGRHRLTGVTDTTGTPVAARGPALVVTGTGHPRGVERTALEAGFAPVRVAAYRDHHWFRETQARAELARAADTGATLVTTAKDAVRWPLSGAGVAVLRVEWEWLFGGDELLRAVLQEEA